MGSNHHQPAPPRDPEPPAIIRQLTKTITHPSVRGVGLTTTSNGDWALLVNVEQGVPVPIPEIEKQARGQPVVYAPVQGLPVARPAYPAKGE